jgi:two-component system OmpR family response regulator
LLLAPQRDFPYEKSKYLGNTRSRYCRYIDGMNPETILIVDDDREIRSLLSTYLEQAGFVVSVAANAAEMFAHLAIATPSLVILDVMMPGQDGVAALKQLRDGTANVKLSRDVPVLMLTALGEPIERSRGLEVGADDYLGKPFLPRELLARVKAVLRRTSGLVPVGALNAAGARNLRFFSGWCVDLDRQQVLADTGEELALTGAEYRLLVAFTERPQRVLSREALLELTHADNADSFDRSVDVLVSRLRNKMGDTAKTPKLIRTVRGGGYMFVEQVVSERPTASHATSPESPSAHRHAS